MNKFQLNLMKEEVKKKFNDLNHFISSSNLKNIPIQLKNKFKLNKIYKNVYKIKLTEQDSELILNKINEWKKDSLLLYNLQQESISNFIRINYQVYKFHYGKYLNSNTQPENPSIISSSNNESDNYLFPCCLLKNNKKIYVIKLSKNISSIQKELHIISLLQKPIKKFNEEKEDLETSNNESINVILAKGSKYIMNYSPFLISIPLSSIENQENNKNNEENENQSFKMGLLLNFERNYINFYDYIIKLKNNLSALTIFKLLKKIFYLISFLHLKGVSHGDLKLNNFLVSVSVEGEDSPTNPDILLIDFDHAYVKKDQDMKEKTQTIIKFNLPINEDFYIDKITEGFSDEFLTYFNNSTHNFTEDEQFTPEKNVHNGKIPSCSASSIEDFVLIIKNNVDELNFLYNYIEVYLPKFESNISFSISSTQKNLNKNRDYETYLAIFNDYDKLISSNSLIINSFDKLLNKRFWMMGGTYNYLTMDINNYYQNNYNIIFENFTSKFMRMSRNNLFIYQIHVKYLSNNGSDDHMYKYMKENIIRIIENYKLIKEIVSLYKQYYISSSQPSLDSKKDEIEINFIAKLEFLYSDFDYYCYRDIWTIGMILYELMTNSLLLWNGLHFKKSETEQINFEKSEEKHSCNKEWCYWNHTEFHVVCPLIYEKSIDYNYESPPFSLLYLYQSNIDKYNHCSCYYEKLKRRKKTYEIYMKKFSSGEYVSEAKLLQFNLLKQEVDPYFLLEIFIILLLSSVNKFTFSSIFIIEHLFPEIEKNINCKIEVNEKLNFILNNPNIIEDENEDDEDCSNKDN